MELRLAQPALSRLMHRLEETVGTKLLHRGPRGVKLTAAGSLLLSETAPAFDRIDDALRKVRLAAEGKLGTLRVGMTRSAVESASLGNALRALSEEFPGISMVITELDSVQQNEQLESGALDLALGIAGVGDSELRSVPLLALRMDSAVLPAAHPLAMAKSVGAHQLRDETLMLSGPFDTPPLSDLLGQLRSLGVERWEIQPSLASILSLVAAGRGWGVIPSAHVLRPPAGTVICRLEGFDFTLTLAARSRRDDDSPLVANVAAILQRILNTDAAELPEAQPAKSHTPVSGAVQLRHLRALVATGDSRSLSHAAHRLGVSQSGLSRQIRSLERDLGVVLLRRRSGGIELTAAGEVLRLEAIQILALIEAAVSRVRGMTQGITGHCTIATLSTEFTGEPLNRAIKHVSQHHPGIVIEVEEMLSLAQIARLHERRADIGIAGANTNLVEEPAIDCFVLSRDVVDSALIAADHPLAERSVLTPADLADVPFCFLDRETHPRFYDTVMESLAGIGLVPRITGAFNGPTTIWRAAADLGGWSLGSRALRGRAPDGMVAVPIEGLQIPSGFHLLWRRDETDPAVLAVLECFHAHAGS